MSVLAGLTYRGAALLLSTAMVAVAGLSVPAPGARAASAGRSAALGALTVTPTSGTVDGSPMLTSATTSTPCPAGYGAAALLRVGPPGGPYSNIARPAGAGGYDRAPVTMNPNRSMATSQGRPPADGEYLIVVECVGETRGTHPERFEAPIVVRGNTWRLGGDTADRPGGDTGGRPGGDTGGRPDPAGSRPGEGATGAPSAGEGGPAGTPSAVPSGAAGEPAGATGVPELASGRDQGAPSLPWILGGVALLVVAVGAAVPLIRRRGGRAAGRRGDGHP
ncbi:hypothetical protein ACN27G_28130 [Plantactinospora sp. WMMB334]|uniref:hypothetical protein n=1 Tax=Plantactinospora sp. WMMB334 TaxID=3404119 RepID=UPI003B9372D0